MLMYVLAYLCSRLDSVTLAPRSIRKPAGRQEMTKAEVVQVRSVTGSLACGPDSGGKRPARSSLAARRLGSQQPPCLEVTG